MFYNFWYVVLFFIIYSFLGWIAEVLAEVYHNKRVVNRGFLLGPWCPIYGVAAFVITVMLNRYLDSPVILFCMSMIICGLLEYFTSYLMEKMFKARWWDYSEKKYNINGRVSLDALFLFAIGSMIIVYFINPLVFDLFKMLPKGLVFVLALILLVIFVLDVIVSFNAISKVSSALKKVERDNTFEITEKVKERIKNKSFLSGRLIKAFPKIKAKGKLRKK